jgi:hypothetical protein
MASLRRTSRILSRAKSSRIRTKSDGYRYLRVENLEERSMMATAEGLIDPFAPQTSVLESLRAQEI